jgi:hypothetical protein
MQNSGGVAESLKTLYSGPAKGQAKPGAEPKTPGKP